jgi:hypothetical protein
VLVWVRNPLGSPTQTSEFFENSEVFSREVL